MCTSHAQTHSHRYSTHTHTSKYTATVCSYIHTYISTVCMIVCTLSVYLKPDPLCHSSHLPQELCSVLLLQLQEIPGRGRGRARWNTTQHNTTQHNTTQHNTTQRILLLYPTNTAQHNPVYLTTCNTTQGLELMVRVSTDCRSAARPSSGLYRRSS